MCKSCKNQCNEEEAAIQCQECKYWMHYRCTNLPEYQLYLYECTQRRFTCKFCVDIDDEFSENLKASQNLLCSTDLNTKVTNANEVFSLCQKLELTQDDTRIQIHSNQSRLIKAAESKSVAAQTDSSYHPESTIERKSSSCQTDKNFQLVDLQELQKSTVSSLQESFVGAFDRMNESVRGLKINFDEEKHLRQKMNDLLKENERLRAKISEEPSQEKFTKKTCQSCDDMTHRVDKLTKALEKEKENTQSKIHELTLHKETHESKMKADALLLQHRSEIMTKQLQQNEGEAMEKRMDNKNTLISTLEEKTGNMAKIISDLQDEVLSWKLHGCRTVN